MDKTKFCTEEKFKDFINKKSEMKLEVYHFYNGGHTIKLHNRYLRKEIQKEVLEYLRDSGYRIYSVKDRLKPLTSKIQYIRTIYFKKEI